MRFFIGGRLFDRIKEKLRNGELLIPGDQWLHFLYAGQTFDQENPWKGLFRSSILVFVSPFAFLQIVV
jgi:hypothetical protein